MSKRPLPKRILRFIVKILLVCIVLLFSVIAAIRIPYVQNVIAVKATKYISDKIGSTVYIDRLYFTYNINLVLEGLCLETLDDDVLLHLSYLESGVKLWPLFLKEVHLKPFQLHDVQLNIHKDSLGISNYDFILEAFESNKDEETDSKTEYSSSSLIIFPSSVNIKNIAVTYQDQYDNIYMDGFLGLLNLHPKKIDLQNMMFDIKSIAFKDSRIRYDDHSAAIKDIVKSDSIPPASLEGIINIDHILLRHLDIQYASTKDTFSTKSYIGDINLRSLKANLSNESINFKDLSINNSQIFLFMSAPDQTQESEELQWPIDLLPITTWNIHAGKVLLKDDSFVLQHGHNINVDRQPKNVMDLLIDDVDIRNIKMVEEEISAQFEKLSITDKNTISLKDLTGTLNLNPKTLSIEKLNIKLEHSEIAGDLQLHYGGITRIQNIVFELSLRDCIFDPVDLERLNIEALEDERISHLLASPIYMDVRSKGKIDDFKIDRLLVSLGHKTTLSGNGRVRGLPDVNKMVVDLPNIEFNTIKKDVIPFIQDDEVMGYLPDYINIKSSISGGIHAASTMLNLSTDKGILIFDALHTRSSQDFYTFSGFFEVDELDSHFYSGEEDWLTIHLGGNFEGEGRSLDDFKLSSIIDIHRLPYADAEFCETEIHIQGENRIFNIDLISDEVFLETNSSFIVELDTLKPSYSGKIDIASIQLQPLRLHQDMVNMALVMDASFDGNLDVFSTNIFLEKGKIGIEQETYTIPTITVSATTDSSSFMTEGNSDWIRWKAESNTHIMPLVQSLQSFVNQDSSYLDKERIESRFVTLQGHLMVENDPVLSELLIPDLEHFETSGLQFFFNEKSGQLNIEWPWSIIQYDGITVENTKIDFTSDGNNLDYSIGFDRLTRDDIDIYATKLFGALNLPEKNVAATLENRSSNDDVLVNLATSICYFPDSLVFHIYADETIINKNYWSIPTSNNITYLDKRLIIEDFILESDNQSLELYTIKEKEDDHLGIQFTNFQISSFTAVLNEDAPPLEGTIMGSVMIENMFDIPGFEANVFIEDLYVLNEPFGIFSIKAEGTDDLTYTIETMLRDGPILFEGAGFYDISGEKPTGEVRLNLEQVDVSILNKLIPDDIQDAQGEVRGLVNLYQKDDNISYDGQLTFLNASFLVNAINERFTLQDEKISLGDNKITFERFKIVNSENQMSRISGYLDLNNTDDIGLDLRIRADNFRVINSTAADNSLFYGRIFIDFSCDVTGSVSQPLVKATTRLNKGTNVTFVVPEEQLDIIEKEGVVIFVNVADGDLERLDEERLAVSDIRSIDLTAVLEVDSASVLKVIVDERSGDFIQVRGEANLNFTLDPNGRMALSGIYSVNEGRYELNLYDLVRRRFDFVPGSSIVWSGDPYNAQLDLRALYRVRTAPMDLMSRQLAGSDMTTRTSYRQELPFEVYLNIGNELTQPEISFALDMPESHRNALNGSVYSRILQLNETESELNKQVFSLMVLNRFMPEDMAGAGGGTGAIARSSVSQVLTSQLNTLSDRFIQGVDLDFGVDSYTDFQTGAPIDRTQFSVQARKALFDDRLVILVGNQIELENSQHFNQNATDIIGDISIEYLMTEDGRYRVKGFRKNEFEGMVEGLLIVAGVAVSYRREFDRINELWKKPEKQKQIDTTETPQPLPDTINIDRN